MIKRLVALAFLVLFTEILWNARPLLVSAANDWLTIDPADLAMKDNPASPGADAMILYRESVVSVKDVMLHGDSDQEYVRIKIFTDAGKKYANVEIPYFGGGLGNSSMWVVNSNAVSITGVRGRTIHPDGSIVPFDGKVYDKVAESNGGFKVRLATFTLPDVQPGSIIEYKYVKQGEPYWVHSEEWTVSQDLYTREAHFTFIPPKDDLGIAFHARRYGIAEELKCNVGVDRACLMDVRNIPGITNEPLMPPRGAITSRVEWAFGSESEGTNETADHYWARIGKQWDTELEHFLDKRSVLGEEVTRVVSPGDSPEVKLRKLYARAQQIRNLSFEDRKSQQEVKFENVKKVSNAEDILRDGYGTAREIDILFVGLARAAGFEATDLRVARRDSAIFVPQIKDDAQLGSDVVWVKAGDKEYYLDPGSKFFPFGLLPWYETEVSGLRLADGGVQNVQTPRPESKDALLMRHADLKIGSDGSIQGNLQVDFSGEEGAELRRQMFKEDETGRQKDLENEIKGWLPAGTSFEISNIANWDDVEKPVHAEGTLKLATFGSVAGNRMLLPEDLFLSPDAQDFSSEKRINAIWFPYPYEEVDELKIKPPAEFKVESAPKTEGIRAGAVTYDISAAPDNSTVDVKRHLVESGVAFPADVYPALRNFYGNVRTYDNGQIVFENVESAKGN